MEICSVLDDSFKGFGRVLDVDVAELVAKLAARPQVAAGQVVYEPSVAEFEAMALFKVMQEEVYGGMPVELGHCSGFNDTLNALEYHRDSEIDIAATDLILLLGHQWDIDYQGLTYDTKNVRAFFVPKGTAVELFATTLHYAPCGINGQEFRCGVVLPRGTNEDLAVKPEPVGEAKLLLARNKWLLAHEESGIEGAYIGLRGNNIKLDQLAMEDGFGQVGHGAQGDNLLGSYLFQGGETGCFTMDPYGEGDTMAEIEFVMPEDAKAVELADGRKGWQLADGTAIDLKKHMMTRRLGDKIEPVIKHPNIPGKLIPLAYKVLEGTMELEEEWSFLDQFQ